jgi:DNA repair photolyase
MGVRIWAFITPILPGITNVELMMNALDKDIPVFLDKIRLKRETKPALTMERFINKHYPELANQYQDIIYNDADIYYDQVRAKWGGDKRVKFVFEKIS